MDAVKSVLSDFYMISNLKVNPYKSLIVPLGPDNVTNRAPLELDPCFLILDKESFKYLGVNWSPFNSQLIADDLFEMETRTVKNIMQE